MAMNHLVLSYSKSPVIKEHATYLQKFPYIIICMYTNKIIKTTKAKNTFKH